MNSKHYYYYYTGQQKICCIDANTYFNLIWGC